MSRDDPITFIQSLTWKKLEQGHSFISKETGMSKGYSYNVTNCIHTTMNAMLLLPHSINGLNQTLQIQSIEHNIIDAIQNCQTSSSQIFAFAILFRKQLDSIFNCIPFNLTRWTGHGFVIWKYNHRYFMIQAWKDLYCIVMDKRSLPSTINASEVLLI
jgi:hypothetical protein